MLKNKFQQKPGRCFCWVKSTINIFGKFLLKVHVHDFLYSLNNLNPVLQETTVVLSFDVLSPQKDNST